MSFGLSRFFEGIGWVSMKHGCIFHDRLKLCLFPPLDSIFSQFHHIHVTTKTIYDNTNNTIKLFLVLQQLTSEHYFLHNICSSQSSFIWLIRVYLTKEKLTYNHYNTLLLNYTCPQDTRISPFALMRALTIIYHWGQLSNLKFSVKLYINKMYLRRVCHIISF